MTETIISAQLSVKKLIFIFHGYGASKDDLHSVGEAFSKTRPEAEIHLANGIEECDSGNGFQWFPLESYDVDSWEKAFEKNEHKIMSYVDAVVSEKNLSYGDVVFTGFSQGAMISLSLGLKYGASAVVAFSGLLLCHKNRIANLATKVLLVHGAKDNVIPIEQMYLAENILKRSGINVKTAVSQNLSHGIDGYLLAQAVDFLKNL